MTVHMTVYAARTTAATISECGRFRTRLERSWPILGSSRGRLLVAMFNPSWADASRNDQTMDMVEAIAQHNGFGSVLVMNPIPFRSSTPRQAIEWARRSAVGRDLGGQKVLEDNLRELRIEAGAAEAILVAWGSLASSLPGLFERVQRELDGARRPTTPLLCLGRTQAGHPLHPLARGKLRLSKTAELQPWTTP